jgi:hypothetical protein
MYRPGPELLSICCTTHFRRTVFLLKGTTLLDRYVASVRALSKRDRNSITASDLFPAQLTPRSSTCTDCPTVVRKSAFPLDHYSRCETGYLLIRFHIFIAISKPVPFQPSFSCFKLLLFLYIQCLSIEAFTSTIVSASLYEKVWNSNIEHLFLVILPTSGGDPYTISLLDIPQFPLITYIAQVH